MLPTSYLLDWELQLVKKWRQKRHPANTSSLRYSTLPQAWIVKIDTVVNRKQQKAKQEGEKTAKHGSNWCQLLYFYDEAKHNPNVC